MDDGVGAQVERLLQVGGREGVVDDDRRADGVGCVGGPADVDHVQHGIRRRLDPDHPHVVVEVRGEVLVELVGGDVREPVALRLVDERRHPVDAAVDIGDQDDALAWVDEVHERGRRTDAGAERNPVRRVLEARERDLERAARGVRDARVVVALVLADRLLHVGGGLVDRRDDRAGRRVGLLPDVNRARLEVEAVEVHRREPTGAAPGSRAAPNCPNEPCPGDCPQDMS